MRPAVLGFVSKRLSINAFSKVAADGFKKKRTVGLCRFFSFRAIYKCFSFESSFKKRLVDFLGSSGETEVQCAVHNGLSVSADAHSEMKSGPAELFPHRSH